ncbi:MAG: hypothetical protein GY898_23135 [Proteobacteria bacterium]|nr:hypothetical protein [Pseudomonadota bacterium]
MAPRKLTPETKTVRYMINGLGMIADRTARRVKRISFDLFGFVDVIGFKPRNLAGYELQGAGAAPWLCVQTTTSKNQGARKRKILESEVLAARAYALVASGHQVQVWGWISGRHAGAEAFRRWTLSGESPGRLEWHDRGVIEVPPELLVQP